MKKKLILLFSISLGIILTSCKENKNININITDNTNLIKDDNNEIKEIKDEKSPLGVWWWDKKLDLDEYITFAKENNINEIYFCDYHFGDELNELFNITKKNDIKVYLLLGEVEWLENRTSLDTIINNYIDYQNNHQNAFSGIHLDIEPHQMEDFKENRKSYLYSLVDIVKTNKDTYPSINFDYDIPFWLDDKIVFNNEEKETYKHIIDYADRTFLMSYRDTKDAMYDVSKEEIAYAKETNKIVCLGAETYSTEGDHVSYLEEGSRYMMNELTELKKMIPSNFGIAIHHIKSWKNLKE